MRPGKSLAILILASLAVMSCKRGGDALDLSFFELEGPVRAVSWTGGVGLTSGQWDFSREGALERGVWEVTGRDLHGRIRSASYVEVDGDTREEFHATLEFTLDKDGAPVSAINRNDFGEYEYLFVRQADKLLGELSLRDLADTVSYITGYHGYECDSLGNWTVRHYTVSCGGKVINSGTECRDIVYYDE
ncbi:MAG: hypothetical protein J5769_00220 [Bacteroidales bacterium]|nr:hypothetical protein [Bacteroidales bacterium]